MTNLSNKLVLLFFILSGYFLGINQAQNIIIKGENLLKSQALAAIQYSASARYIGREFYPNYMECLYTKKNAQSTRDITKTYHYAIRHNFLHTKALEMCFGGIVGRGKLFYASEYTPTSIQIELLKQQYVYYNMSDSL